VGKKEKKNLKGQLAGRIRSFGKQSRGIVGCHSHKKARSGSGCLLRLGSVTLKRKIETQKPNLRVERENSELYAGKKEEPEILTLKVFHGQMTRGTN